jgi:hypothetical protein
MMKPSPLFVYSLAPSSPLGRVIREEPNLRGRERMQLTLTEPEREFLLEILQIRLGEMREEVYHTTVSTYKDMLKGKEAMLQDLIARLSSEV